MPYDRFQQDELILRDELALDRTRLANERTLLSYARTGLMLAVTGGTAIKLFGEESKQYVLWGGVLIIVGIAIGLFGLWRFFAMSKELNRLRQVVDRERSAGE
jgi:putative membrane protein